MGDQWYCMVVGQEVGPITSDDLLEMFHQGQIDADDTVRDGPAGDWQPLHQALDVPAVAVDSSEVPADTPVGTPSNRRAPTWYTRMLGSEFGPFTIDEIREQAAQEQLAPDDEVREGHIGPWKPASTIPDLFSDSALRQRQIEIEQAKSEREQRKRERQRARGAKKVLTKKRSDDLLDGLDSLEDVPMPAAPAGLSAFSAKSLPTDPAARTEMLKKLDAEYQRLRSQLTSPAEPSSPAGAPASPPSYAPAAHSNAATNPQHDPAGSASRATPIEPPGAAVNRPAPSSINSAPAISAAPPAPPEPPRAVSVMQEMAAAQIRSAQSSARPAPRAPYAPSSRSSGGGGFDFSSLNISGKTVGIAAAVVGVLAIGYFGLAAGLIDFSSGAVYDETVKLYGEFKKVAEKDPASAEFTSFQQDFKKKQQEMLRQLGQPSRGSTADEVRRAVLALGTVIEAYRRPEITKAEREPYINALDSQMTKLKQSFGR